MKVGRLRVGLRKWYPGCPLKYSWLYFTRYDFKEYLVFQISKLSIWWYK